MKIPNTFSRKYLTFTGFIESLNKLVEAKVTLEILITVIGLLPINNHYDNYSW